MKTYKVWVEVEEVDAGQGHFKSVSIHEIGRYTTLGAAKGLREKILLLKKILEMKKMDETDKEKGDPIIPEEMIPPGE